MRVLPNSLFGRLALILLSGLILAQLASIALEFRDRGQRMFQASGVYSAERIAEIVRLLDDVSPSERKRLVSILNIPTPRVSLTTPAWSATEKASESWPTVEFRKRLQRQLGPAYALRVAVSDQPARGNTGAMGSMHKFGDRSGGHMQSMNMVAPDTLLYLAQVKLTDGAWVTFENRIDDEIFADSSVLLLTLAILLATVIIVSLLAVRLVTRPLTMLALAADKLGSDINQPPLPETGPLETRHAAQAFNAMQHRLQRFIEDRTRLLSAISHDLKTPITRMRLRAEMLDDPEQRTSFVENLDEMQAIASETLDFLRADDSRETLQAIDVCVLLETIKDDGAELGQDISIDNCQLTPFRARPLALKRCIVNLVDNAIKYGSNARVAASDNKETLVITVTDSGPGIPEQKLETVFEPFYRLESSRNRETGGTGLGLSIARNIALSHGGDLQLRNISPGGLAATLTLPRRPL